MRHHLLLFVLMIAAICTARTAVASSSAHPKQQNEIQQLKSTLDDEQRHTLEDKQHILTLTQALIQLNEEVQRLAKQLQQQQQNIQQCIKRSGTP